MRQTAGTRSWSQTLRRILDVTILVLIVGTTWRMWSASAPVAAAPPERLLGVGQVFKIAEIDFANAQRHLVLRLDTSCAACNDSLPFYRELFATAAEKNVAIHVFGDEEESTISEWLANAGLKAPSIINHPNPGQLGLLLIPSVFVLDNRGTILDVAIEKLNADQQAKLKARVEGTSAVPFDNTSYAREISADAVATKPEGADAVRLDIRDREEAGSTPGVINMPYKEIPVLAPLQLADGATVVIDCQRVHLTECRIAGRTLIKLGHNATIAVRP